MARNKAKDTEIVTFHRRIWNSDNHRAFQFDLPVIVTEIDEQGNAEGFAQLKDGSKLFVTRKCYQRSWHGNIRGIMSQ